MKEYVAVPDDLLEDTDRWRNYFETSLVYASGLKPKPSRKTRKRAW
jgi:TfoX/Sxy family transcriptional regulator of competence genes